MESDEKSCPFCAETIKTAAIKCRYCGEFLKDSPGAASSQHNSSLVSPVNRGIAAAMSLIWPGMGHVFQGRLLIGFISMALVAFFAMVAIMAGFIGWFILACLYIGIVYDAYHYDPAEFQPRPADGRLTLAEIEAIGQKERLHQSPTSH